MKPFEGFKPSFKVEQPIKSNPDFSKGFGGFKPPEPDNSSKVDEKKPKEDPALKDKDARPNAF